MKYIFFCVANVLIEFDFCFFFFVQAVDMILCSYHVDHSFILIYKLISGQWHENCENRIQQVANHANRS